MLQKVSTHANWMSTEYVPGFALNCYSYCYHYSHNIVAIVNRWRQSMYKEIEYLPTFLEVHQRFTGTIPLAGYLYAIAYAIPFFLNNPTEVKHYFEDSTMTSYWSNM